MTAAITDATADVIAAENNAGEGGPALESREHERAVSERLPRIGDRLTIRREGGHAAGSKALRFRL